MTIATLATAESPGWPDALPLLPHPGEMIIGVIAFGILYWVFASKVVPALEKLYAERTAAIEGGINKAEEAQAQAAAALEQYNAQLREARAEAHKMREDAKAQGAQIVAEMRQQAQAESARIGENAQRQILAERQAAVASLRQEIGGLSTDLASRIVGESLQDEVRQRGIVERFLADLESGAVRPEKVGSEKVGSQSAAPAAGDPAGSTVAAGSEES